MYWFHVTAVRWPQIQWFKITEFVPVLEVRGQKPSRSPWAQIKVSAACVPPEAPTLRGSCPSHLPSQPLPLPLTAAVGWGDPLPFKDACGSPGPSRAHLVAQIGHLWGPDSAITPRRLFGPRRSLGNTCCTGPRRHEASLITTYPRSGKK